MFNQVAIGGSEQLSGMGNVQKSQSPSLAADMKLLEKNGFPSKAFELGGLNKKENLQADAGTTFGEFFKKRRGG